MDVNTEIKEALRYMLLPIPSYKETECLEAIRNILSKQGVAPASYSSFIKIKYEAWRSDNQIHPSLRDVIEQTLAISNPEVGAFFAKKYFDIHVSLLRNPFISFDLAVILLSHLRLITSLAHEERMSSAKIANVLKSIDGRLNDISWKEVQNILRILRLIPELRQYAVEELYEEDEKLEVEYFADADIDDAVFQVGDVAKKLQFNNDAESLLKKLSDPKKAHLPYLQILHYQCLISGFYDHVLSVPYEFNPRGLVAEWLFKKWDTLVHTSNPILNNAKAVDVLDENWARSRKTNEYEQAVVLIELFKGLDEMGFAAAQELTSWIRRLLIRYIKINSVEIKPIGPNLDDQHILEILESIKGNATNTYGILEQRYVDVLATILYMREDGWRSRGLGDSVNTNNLSRKKLGDCDFQNSNSKNIVAFEAHGGHLTKIYLEGHLRTLRRSFSARIEELENIADLQEWKVKVFFVAYKFDDGLQKGLQIDNFSIEIEYVTFNDLLSRLPDNYLSDSFKGHFRLLFVDVINNRRTPSFVRDKVRKFLKQS